MEHHVFEIEGELADPVAQCGGRLQSIDVRIRLVVALAALAVTIGARGLALPLVMLVLSTAVSLALRVRPALLLARMAAPFSIAVVVMAGQLFFWKGQPLFALSVGPWSLVASHEGLGQGLLIGGHILGSVSIVMALAFSTPFQHLLAAARWFRAPATMVDLASLIYRYLFLLREEAVTMMSAQRSRLGYADYRRGLRSASALCGMSFIRAYDRSMDVHRAMLCRGYTGELRGEILPPAGLRELAQLAAGLAVLALGLYLDTVGL